MSKTNMVDLDDIQFHIRDLDDISVDEMEDIAAMTRDSFAIHLKNGIHFMPSRLNGTELRAFLSPPTTLFMYYAAQTPVAIAAVSVKTDDGGTRYIPLKLITVSPEYKRLHLGSRLYEKCFAWAEKQKAAYMLLDTSTRATSAKAFHHANGFKNWYYTHFRAANYYSIVMRKDLNRPYSDIKRLLRLYISYIRVLLCIQEYTGKDRFCIKLWYTCSENICRFRRKAIGKIRSMLTR